MRDVRYNPRLLRLQYFLNNLSVLETTIDEDGYKYTVTKSLHPRTNAIYLSNIVSNKPGCGRFDVFLHKIQEIVWSMKDGAIVIEAVTNERLAAHLKHRNWRQINLRNKPPAFIRLKNEVPTYSGRA